jgi:hypothetical protein
LLKICVFRPPLTGTKAVPLGSIGPIGPDRLPVYVDWNKFGAVTPVQDQGDCGTAISNFTRLVFTAVFSSSKKHATVLFLHLFAELNTPYHE